MRLIRIYIIVIIINLYYYYYYYYLCVLSQYKLLFLWIKIEKPRSTIMNVANKRLFFFSPLAQTET